MRYNTHNYLKIYNTFYSKPVVGVPVNGLGHPLYYITLSQTLVQLVHKFIIN